jgi:hypothetical protein
MGLVEILLLAMAIAIWLIWYELRYGIEARKESRRMARNLRRKWKAESDAKWKEFSDARKDEKTWKEYVQKEASRVDRKPD